MKKIAQSIGHFLANAVEGIENFFKNTLLEIGKWFKKETDNLQALFDALLAEIKALTKEAVSDITTAAIAAAKLLLTDLIAAL